MPIYFFNSTTKEVLSLPLSDALFVLQQDYAKATERISAKLGGRMGREPRNTQNFFLEWIHIKEQIREFSFHYFNITIRMYMNMDVDKTKTGTFRELISMSVRFSLSRSSEEHLLKSQNDEMKM